MRGRPRASPDLRHRGADQERARDDDDDVVAEAGEGLVGGHDADSHRDQQRQARDEVVAEAPPDEERHHPGDDGEGEDLRMCHGARGGGTTP